MDLFLPDPLVNALISNGCGVTGWVSNSILSTVKTMLISGVIREKNQRLEAVTGVDLIYQ